MINKIKNQIIIYLYYKIKIIKKYGYYILIRNKMNKLMT